MRKQIGFLKTTAIGGLIFLLPLIVIGALVGQVAQIVYVVAVFISENVPIATVGGWAMAVLLAIAAVLLTCFFAGLAARRSLGQRLSTSIEKYLLLFFPRYMIIKEQTAGTLGGDDTRPQLKPVLVRLDEMTRVAFEVERHDPPEASNESLVTIYFPGSPDPWAGYLALVEHARVEPLEIDFSDALAVCEQLGRGSAALVASRAAGLLVNPQSDESTLPQA